MEAAIEKDLINAGYFKREPLSYDKSLCLHPELLLNFLLATQKDKWKACYKQLGNRAKDALLTKIKDEIDTLWQLLWNYCANLSAAMAYTLTLPILNRHRA